jgi:hypothetical protein
MKKRPAVKKQVFSDPFTDTISEPFLYRLRQLDGGTYAVYKTGSAAAAMR